MAPLDLQSLRTRLEATFLGRCVASFVEMQALDRSMVIASAAAVASSRSDALARSMAVRSLTMVWKLRSASSRPCEISGWYGVYAVYQAGFSRTLRWMTAGVTVP